jgi:hypothetical protein
MAPRTTCEPAGSAWLLAQRGCTVAPDVRLHTLAEVIEYLDAGGRTDRDKFVAGKTKQNAVKSMVFTDAKGRMLSAARLGRAAAPASPKRDSSDWPSSWPTARSWRSSRMPAIKAWERRPAAG